LRKSFSSPLFFKVFRFVQNEFFFEGQGVFCMGKSVVPGGRFDSFAQL